jgi:nitroreductase
MPQFECISPESLLDLLRERRSNRDRIYHEYLNGDVGMAALQMMLQAKALGLGSCWIGSLDREAIAGLLRIPDYYEIVSVLTIGYPAEKPETPPRRPLQEIVHHDL